MKLNVTRGQLEAFLIRRIVQVSMPDLDKMVCLISKEVFDQKNTDSETVYKAVEQIVENHKNAPWMITNSEGTWSVEDELLVHQFGGVLSGGGLEDLVVQDLS